MPSPTASSPSGTTSGRLSAPSPGTPSALGSNSRPTAASTSSGDVGVPCSPRTSSTRRRQFGPRAAGTPSS
eukprot:7404569-Alexandrium_andersonii.AAC.1